ncbi:MAG TPA: shikimate kinase [Streptosporangiaceae bacterium]|nr:shikimate kinase [Streptosporangiaceae bacterium]
MIVLVGFMGAGKTTVGRRLAAELDLAFIDLDRAIEEGGHRSVKEIFAADGEAAFRTIEHEALARVLAGPSLVLAVGGGAVEHAGSRRLLAAADVVYLQVSYADALARVGGDAGRPMLARPDLAQVYQRRLAGYESVATLIVATGGRGTRAVCAEVLTGLARRDRAGYPH